VYRFGQAPAREAADGPAQLTPAAARAGKPGLFDFFQEMHFYLNVLQTLKCHRNYFEHASEVIQISLSSLSH
jgi:hypothetical protein